MQTVNPEELLGQLIRPWADEPLIAAVVHRDGDLLECHAAGGGTFFVHVSDVLSGKIRALDPNPDQHLRRAG